MTKTQTDGGPAPCSPPGRLTMADHVRVVRPPMPLYVGTQNDGLFLLDKPPSPAPYDGPIPAHYGPAVVIGNWPRGSDKAIEAVARYSERVDAFVRALEAERDELRSGLIEAGAIKDENERLRDALTPSADTKAAYMGEFRLGVRLSHPHGGEDYRSIDIPWTTIKEIMGAIRDRAALNGGGDV